MNYACVSCDQLTYHLELNASRIWSMKNIWDETQSAEGFDYLVDCCCWRHSDSFVMSFAWRARWRVSFDRRLSTILPTNRTFCVKGVRKQEFAIKTFYESINIIIVWYRVALKCRELLLSIWSFLINFHQKSEKGYYNNNRHTPTHLLIIIHIFRVCCKHVDKWVIIFQTHKRRERSRENIAQLCLINIFISSNYTINVQKPFN